MSSRRHFGTVRQRSSGRWQAIYWNEGHPVSGGTFANKADAQARLSEIEVSMRRGNGVDPRAGRGTLRDYANEWLDHRPDLAVRTVDLYRHILDRHVLPELGARLLADLSPSEVRSWHAQLARHVPATAAKAYRLLSSIMRTALTDELITVSPCRVKGAGVERAPERPVATVEDLAALVDALPAYLKVVVPLATWCQLRRGELLGLQRQDIDLANFVIHVRRSRTHAMDGRMIEKAPKTAAGARKLAIPPSVASELARHLKTFCGTSPESPVLVSTSGDALTRNSLESAWQTARKRIGRPDLRLHDLRHTGLTFAATAGATTAELMHRAGHASSVAALRYQHAISERDRSLAMALEVMVHRSESKTSDQAADGE